ncbi:bifunctional 4-hydroxy-2-oxoglutarate aldolase/2-dehydro-3-deoxy-phosphogluconate aldolase [Zongyangia sp. HA2173]|uniref:bifunctional 4-hydroxy-2-oxoglutarate aldolase/2-dehydro-3-deoxy-phosphogluconate aldolase n=1 Tax=Zongyangia sp. HA2173 TaxID=3133035 RepID=UPI0031613E08
MKYTERLSSVPVIPVVVLENAADAVQTAKALLAGGIDVMEITLRTAAALDAIRFVSKEVPEMLVGAGTVLSQKQAQEAVEAGAQFIVSPGFDRSLVQWCVEQDITVTPGCVTPTEITSALSLGVDVIKFFPAGVYGGLSAMKSLAGPFPGVKFIPTGGVNLQNIAELLQSPFILTVGGSWLCPKQEIAAGNFDSITQLTKQAVSTAMGFEIAHIGINASQEKEALEIAQTFADAFGFPVKNGNSSIFSGSKIEIMKSASLGHYGHIAVSTNDISKALSYLEKKGFGADLSTAKYKGNRMNAVYLSKEIGGFAIHLLQR